MHGMGSTPSFLVEGSWVIGFFRDAQEKQQPIIIGSLPGSPDSEADYSKGFNDPRSPKTNQAEYAGTPTYGPYPVDGEDASMKSGHETMEPDTNRLAQGKTSETHNSLIKRRLNRLRGDPLILDDTVGVDDTSEEEIVYGTGIPTATMPYLTQTSVEATQETRGWWDEPHPKSITKNTKIYRSGQYPYNHVHESESGHIHEIDDSPGAERLFTQHTSGTFEEIHPKGDKVVKVIGDNYEIIAGDSNVSISGDVNITIDGTVRELIRGDYILEVEGNYTQKIHKNQRTKVGAGKAGGNREEEIKGNHSYNIDTDVKGRVGHNVDTKIENSEVRIIGNESSLSVKNAIKIAASGPLDPATGLTSGNIIIVANNYLSTTTKSGITTFKSGDKLNMKSLETMHIKSESDLDMESLDTMYIKSESDIDMDGTDLVDIDAARIDLNKER